MRNVGNWLQTLYQMSQRGMSTVFSARFLCRLLYQQLRWPPQDSQPWQCSASSCRLHSSPFLSFPALSIFPPSFLHLCCSLRLLFHLSLSLRSFGVPSAYSKSRANKQAAGGSRLLSIIQASQTTARMFARHMKCISQHHSERKKEYVLPSWLGLNTQGISHHPAGRLKSCL